LSLLARETADRLTLSDVKNDEIRPIYGEMADAISASVIESRSFRARTRRLERERTYLSMIGR